VLVAPTDQPQARARHACTWARVWVKVEVRGQLAVLVDAVEAHGGVPHGHLAVGRLVAGVEDALVELPRRFTATFYSSHMYHKLRMLQGTALTETYWHGARGSYISDRAQSCSGCPAPYGSQAVPHSAGTQQRLVRLCCCATALGQLGPQQREACAGRARCACRRAQWAAQSRGGCPRPRG